MARSSKKATQIDVTELPAHSQRGPSAAERWLYRPDPETGEMLGCPRSVRLSKDAPDFESEYAALGTAAHWITELARNQNKPAEHYLGYSDKNMPREAGVDGFFTCDQEMVDAVNYFLEYIASFPTTVSFVEIKVTYMKWVEDDGFGTSDHIGIDEESGICDVIDFKYGEGIQVFAPNNVQLMLYALGVYEVYGKKYDWHTFRIHICQPRLDHVDVWEISVKDLIEWANMTLRPGAELTLEHDAPIQAGDWCQWCRIKFRCRTRVKWMLTVLPEDGDEDALLTNDELGAMMYHVPDIVKAANNIKEEALSARQRGERIGGWYLAPGRSDRQWRAEAAFRTACKKARIPVKDIEAPRKLISPAQFEKKYGADHPVLKAHVYKPRGKPVLAKPGSGKPVYELAAADEFKDLDLSEFEQDADGEFDDLDLSDFETDELDFDLSEFDEEPDLEDLL